MNQMLKCAFKTAEMYSVLVKCSMQKQNRDTNRIQDKTKQHDKPPYTTQLGLTHKQTKPTTQNIKTEIRYTTIQK